MKSSLEIAQQAPLRPIEEIAAEAGLQDEEVEPYGRFKAKVSLSVLDRLRDRPDGRLVVVTAITPTMSGEGKTTTAIGLTRAWPTSGPGQPCACGSRRSVRCSGSKAEEPAAGTRRSSRWRTSTCTSPATSTPWLPLTTSWPPRSTPRSTTTTLWGSTTAR